MRRWLHFLILMILMAMRCITIPAPSSMDILPEARESINIGCLLTAILAFVSSPVFRCIQGTPWKRHRQKHGMPFPMPNRKQSEWRFCMGTRETGAIFPVVMMRNGLLHRRWYGSSLRDAVKPQVPTNRPAPRCTTFILDPIIPTVVQGRLMTKLYPYWQNITRFQVLCQAQQTGWRRN